MNKLRIILNEDGSVSQFTPDFKIMRGSYRNVLINLEVPHALLLDPATDMDDGTSTTGNNVRIGAIITTATGKHIQTQRYEFQRVKDFTREGTTYRLYQRRMPKEFTMWETVSSTEDTESGQVTLVINVVNWTTNSLGAQIEEVAASPKFTLDIYPSAFLDEAEEIDEPSDFDELQSQVQDLSADFTTVKTDLYTDSGDGLGDYLKTRLAEGNKIVLTQTDNQIEIAVDTLYASDIVLNAVEDLDAGDLQTALEEIGRRFDSKSVDTITGEDEGLVDNTDPNNPIVLHDATKVDVTTFDETVEGLNSAISTNAEGIATINTNLASYSLINATGASIDLDIDTTNYVMTLALKTADGETLSTKTIDFPLESMVVGATYKSGTLTLTLQNGTTLNIDISSIIDGLVSETDFNELKTQVATNTENITSNATNISTETSERKSADEALQEQITTNATNIATNTSDITDLKAQVETNKTNIESLTEGVDLSALQTQQNTNTANIATNATAISTETTNRENADETLQNNIDSEASTRASADSTLQTNIDNLKLASGATLALSIDETSYVMTIQLKNSAGTTLSTGTVDLPLETMVVSGTYSDGKLYLTLKNGTQLDPIDISDIVSGLVSQTDFDTLKVQVETNTSDIATKATITVDTAENWESSDPVLAEKEFGYDSTNELLKIGNGTDTWSNLPFFVTSNFHKTLEECSWEEIGIIAKAGIAQTIFKVGDEKTVELSTGEEITLIILGFNHDDKSDGTGKANITFGMKHSLATTYYMNSSNTNSGGWGSSYIRGTVMPLYLSYLPEDLQVVIKPVNKLTSAGSLSSTINTTSDSIFLLSHIEVMGTIYMSSTAQRSFSGEGSQYEYFKNADIPTPTTGTGVFHGLKVQKGTFSTSDTSVATDYTNTYSESKTTTADYYYNYNNARGIGASATTASYWWLRSPYSTNSTYFIGCSSAGFCGTINAYYSYGVCFGFCI